ncbi:glycoside hydrolase, partial [Oryctes borbonicus]
MLLSIVITLVIFTSTLAWKTCEEQEFCNNIRFNLVDQPTYSLTDIIVGEDVTGNVINDQNSNQFKFRLVALEGGTVRLTIQDTENGRYTPEEDALDGDPVESSFTVLSEDTLISLGVGPNIIINVYNYPFKIEMLKDGEIIIILNENNSLIINTSQDDKSLALGISFPQAQRVYGIPQHAERLSLPSTGPNGQSAFRMFNVDYYGYPAFSREALYGAVGVLYGISTSITSGIFWMNGAQTFVDINNKNDGVDAFFISETGALELFLFPGPTLQDCVRQFTSLTGVGQLPQYHSLGYHQCRYSYMSQDDVESVVEKFDENDFPMDVIWLDIDYTEDYKYFTWNYTAFPNPLQMQDNVAATGRKLVAISDPHIKVEEGYFVYDEALDNDYFVKNSDGTVFEGQCWPGLSSYVDYFDKNAQEWYGDLYLLENFPDTTLNLYIWNDMNEPSVFEAEEQTMPPDVKHAGGWEHRDVHNLYGMKQVEATRGGLLRRDPTKRPFVLTRAHFAGTQRYAAMWTGDNSPSWEHLQVSIPMVLTESLAGMAFCGADVGGFTDNVADDLLQRWYQAGAWYPFYRGHSGTNT